jgi:SAM-dependent methyltransferase
MSPRTASASVYTLDNYRTEAGRLRAQATNLREHTVALLRPVKLPPDASAIDLGCGPGGALDLISERVGRSGHLLGVDIDSRKVARARIFAEERGLSNVKVMTANARSTGLAGSSYDLVHTRLLLVKIHSPEQVVAEMVRLVRPGGWVAVMEPDNGLRICHPHHASLTRLSELLAIAYRRAGADLYLGRRLPHMLATAGLIEIGVEARTEVRPPGHAQRSVIPDLVQNMRAKILEQGLIEEGELDRLDLAARLHLEDAATLSTPVTYFLAWARKPAWAA